MSFEAFKRQENHAFCTFFKTTVMGTERFEMLYLVDIQPFRQNANGRLFQFQLFQLLFSGCPFPYNYM